MAIKPLEADVEIISKLGTNPGIDDGLSEAQLKAKFDAAAKIIKDYINNYLIHQIDSVVDVDALLKNILDTTLSQSDKAANAAAAGDAIRTLRTFFTEAVHSGDYVLEADGNFAAEIAGEAVVRVRGGKGVMLGNLFSLNLGGYEAVNLEDGTYGLNRNDLIVVRCTRSEDNSLSYELINLTGAQTSGEPVDPEHTRSDINTDGTVRDFPLYRVKFSGYDIVEIVPLFETQKSLEKHLQEYVNEKHFSTTVAVTATGWAGESAPYTQRVAVQGILATDRPHYGVVYSDEQETRLAQKEAFVLVDDLDTTDGSVKFTCFEEKPEVDLTIQLEVNR